MVTTTVIQSDLSRALGAETVMLGLGGSWREIDLTKDERVELEQLLAPYLSVSREAVLPSNRTVPETTKALRTKIRAWALENGLDVNPRGMIPNPIHQAYMEAMGNTSGTVSAA